MEYLIFILLILLGYLYYLYNKEKKRKDKIEEINKNIYKEKENVEKEIDKLNIQINNLKDKKYNVEQEINEKHKILDETINSLNNSTANNKKAFEQYNDVLEKDYVLKQNEYDAAINLLNKSYSKEQDRILAEMAVVRSDLDKISATRAAAIQAQLKEEEIRQQEEFYSIALEEIDKKEVHILQSIENELRDPRPIRMIIWQTYYSKKANELAARVLGSNDICGIYKITNKKNKMCYIGQAKNIRERFREHMKCGLGIDTPANNKLYQAMFKDGIDSFTFELLEVCESNYLDEKENFYIQLYDSYNFGYNSNKGIKKS